MHGLSQPRPLAPGLDPARCSEALQLHSVTSQVCTLQLSEAGEVDDGGNIHDAGTLLEGLFVAPPSSILGTTPPSPSPPMGHATPRKKEAVGPVRCSPRLAAIQSSTPVSQRATLRVAQALHVVDKEEKDVAKAAAAVAGHFKEPLEVRDLDGLAVLTRIDRDAIFRAASQAEMEHAAAAAGPPLVSLVL